MKEKFKKDNNGFLTAGIMRYEEARDTIVAFESEIGMLIKNGVDARKNWGLLKNFRIGSARAGSDVGGHWIGFFIKGKSRRNENVVIDLGTWWKAHEGNHLLVGHPIVYVSFYHQPETVCNFVWSDKGTDISSFIAWNRTFLHLPLRKPEDIESSLNRLLDALLKRLK